MQPPILPRADLDACAFERFGDAPNARRAFVRGAGLAILGAALPAFAQRAGRMPRIAVLVPARSPIEPAFWEGMRELGYIDGKTIAVDRRSADGAFQKLPGLAAELVAGRPDVIVAFVTAASIAAKEATATIPIVMTAVGDPVAAGLVGNLSRPGGNVTGTSGNNQAAVGKQVEMIRQMLPNAKRLALLWNPGNAVFSQSMLGESLIAASRSRMQARIYEARTSEELDRAFAAMDAERPEALLVLSDPVLNVQGTRLAELALARRLPAFGGSRPVVESGLIAAYAPDLNASARRSAVYVQKILKGAKPGDLPVELSDKFELVINLRTAKALDLEIPAVLVARAHEVVR